MFMLATCSELTVLLRFSHHFLLY